MAILHWKQGLLCDKLISSPMSQNLVSPELVWLCNDSIESYLMTPAIKRTSVSHLKYCLKNACTLLTLPRNKTIR